VKLSWKRPGLAILVVTTLVATAGCGGFAAAPSVSPLMFLVPGLGHVEPAQLKAPKVPGGEVMPELVVPEQAVPEAAPVLAAAR